MLFIALLYSVNLNFCVQFDYLCKRVSTRKKKHEHKKQLSQLNETLNNYIIGKITNASAIVNETLEPQTNNLSNSCERIAVGENSACQDGVVDETIDDKIRKAFDNAVMTLKNRIHDAILTAMDNILITRVEMAVRLITESSIRGPSNMVLNPDQHDFTGITKNIALTSAFS